MVGLFSLPENRYASTTLKEGKIARRPLVVGNWKMYPTLSDSLVLASSLKAKLETLKGVEVALLPPIAWLAPIIEGWKHRSEHIQLGVQNIWAEDQGAYTGEVSAYMVKDLAKYALIGHSERRRNQHEDDDIVREKLLACLRWRLTPILCVGETKRVLDASGRVDAYQWQRITAQLMEALHGIKPDDLHRVIFTYEPVWAIGNGRTATPEYAGEVIRRLKERLSEKYPKHVVANVRFLYGGSVEPHNTHELLAHPDIDGLLVGTNSVKAKEFLKICEIAARS